jgi:hypothetical protein
MNKFEALKMFRGWPPEWQRLCAECWIETGEGEDRPAVELPMYDDPIPRPSYRPKAAAKVAAKPARNFMRYTRDEISEVDAHLSEGRGPTEISVMMVRKHPNKRTREAWRKMAQWVRKHGFLVSMNQAVEAEAE